MPLFAPACGGGGSSSDDSDNGSGGGGGGGGSPQVEFSTSSSSLTEETTVVNVIVALSAPVSNDVLVHFGHTGDAQNFVDYIVNTPSPVTIPKLATQAQIEVLVQGDDKGELDETVLFFIVSVDGADSGNKVTHTFTILDDDATLYQENEPNDDIPSANLVGSVARTVAYTISGEVTLEGGGDADDIFIVQVTEDHAIDFSLDPLASGALAKLIVTDPTGLILDEWISPAPGEPAGGKYAATNGQNLFLWVGTEESLTGYFLDVVGLEFSMSNGGGPAPGPPGAER